MFPDMTKIPKLYSQENKKTENIIIYQKWIHPFCPGYFWLISEYSPVEKNAFGYANLNDDQNAEWGYIHLPELIENGALMVKGFEPQPFKTVMQGIGNPF